MIDGLVEGVLDKNVRTTPWGIREHRKLLLSPVLDAFNKDDHSPEHWRFMTCLVAAIFFSALLSKPPILERVQAISLFYK
jgi:hypothetical protein